MSPRRPAPRLLTALLLAGLAFGAGAQSEIRLPDLGSSANALISPQQAQDYGAAMFRQMRALNLVVNDPLLDAYINNLGFRLVAACAKPRDHFAFFIVRSSEINAFSALGGYIGINSGLILLAQNESELAAVMAHEIGHVTQDHLQRAYEAAKKDTPLMALVALGAIAAGAATDGQAAAATLVGGQGLLEQKQIDFTRRDEAEADRAGIQTLANAGFDPYAMAEFLQRMQNALSTGSGGEDVPALLQDHPVTTERISDAKARARQLLAERKLIPSGAALDNAQLANVTAPIPFVKNLADLLPAHPAKDSLDTFLLMRERVRVLANDPQQELRYYAANFARQHGFDTPWNRYGYALALTLTGNGARAVAELQPVLAAHPGNMILRLAMADARVQAGQRAQALAIYHELDAESPHNLAIDLAYAKALTEGGSKAQAAQAAALLRPLLADTDEPGIYTAYARASDKAGDTERAGEAYADASYLSGRPFDAMQQLERLLKRPDLDYYARARIQGQLAQLIPLVMELRKLRIDTPDNPDDND